MIRTTAKLAFAALVAASTFATIPTVASADDFGIEFRFGDGGRYDRPGHRPPEFELRPGGRGRCSPREAVQTARSYGLRHAQIAEMGRRYIIVEGRTRRGWTEMTFANVRGCPVIR